MGLLWYAQPCNLLTIVPFTLSFGLVGHAVPNSCTIHLVILECANISISISEYLGALSFDQAILELSFVSSLVWPHHNSKTVNAIFGKVSFVNLSGVGKVILTFTLKLSFYEVTLVIAAIEVESTLSCLLAIDEVTSIALGTHVPSLGTLTTLLVIEPLAFIERRALGIHENTVSVGFAVFPLTLIDVAVGMGHSTLTVNLLIGSEALIH
jgi:hypothetical protein